jgi:hypothetical protein
MDLIDNALKNRQLSENSITLYKRNVLKLNDNKRIQNFIFLRNKEGVIDLKKKIKTNHLKKLYYIYMFFFKR